jgi:hypothetical protein
VVSKSWCGYQNLYVWPNGKIAGAVRASEGKPVVNIPVQAFIKDQGGDHGSSPSRESKIDASGSYTLTGIPPGEDMIGQEMHVQATLHEVKLQ